MGAAVRGGTAESPPPSGQGAAGSAAPAPGRSIPGAGLGTLSAGTRSAASCAWHSPDTRQPRSAACARPTPLPLRAAELPSGLRGQVRLSPASHRCSGQLRCRCGFRGVFRDGQDSWHLPPGEAGTHQQLGRAEQCAHRGCARAGQHRVGARPRSGREGCVRRVPVARRGPARGRLQPRSDRGGSGRS